MEIRDTLEFPSALFSHYRVRFTIENDTNLSTDSKRRGDRSIDRSCIVEFRYAGNRRKRRFFLSPAIFIAPINSKSVHQIDVSEPKIVVDKLVPPYFLSSYRRRCVLDKRKDNTIYLRVVIYSRGTGESIARRGLLYNRLENHHPNFSGNRV